MLRRSFLFTVLVFVGAAGCVHDDPAVDGAIVSVPAAATTSAPVDATIATTSTLAASSTVAAGDVAEWTRLGVETTESIVGLTDVTAADSGLVAIGFDPGADLRQNGVIVVSDDGVMWTRLGETDPALTSGTVLLYAIAEAESGLVAVGMSCPDDEMPCVSGPYPTVWISADGPSWTRTELEQGAVTGALTGVLATEYGIVASGAVREPMSGSSTALSPAWWLSTDGSTWSRVWTGDTILDVEPAFQPGASAFELGSDGLIVGVGSALIETGEAIAAVWVSTNGVDWERVERDAVGFTSVSGDGVAMLDIAAGSDGFVAVGTDGGTQAAVWTSNDGWSWNRVDVSDQAVAAATSLSAVTAISDGFVAVGPNGWIDNIERPITVWASPDGTLWYQSFVLGRGYASSVLATDTGITVAGAANVGDDYEAAIWFAPLPDIEDESQTPIPPTSDDAATAAPPIENLRSGLSCAELAADALSYAEITVYWTVHGTPAELDPDGNGIPCEDTYTPAEIADVYGNPHGLDVRITAHLSAGVPFEIAGPAVDAGIICSTGTPEFIGNPAPQRPEAYHRWVDTYTCADGSGTFVIGNDVIFQDSYEHGVWNITSGTGAYTALQGGGTSLTGPIDRTSWGGDELIGRLTSNPETNP